MKTSLSKILKLAASAALAGFAFSGCTTSSDTDVTTDGGNVVVAQEANNMGTMLTESSSSPKVAAVNTDSIDVVTGEKVIIFRHYDSGCHCFIRTANFTSSVGFERQRLDSIWLDSSGNLLTVFTPGHADSITHIRHVTRINSTLGKEIDLTFKSTWVKSVVGGVITFNWNGAITGTFNGTTFTNSTIVITRTYAPSTGFGSIAGTIDIHRGNYEVVIVFDSVSGTITCTVTHNGVLVRVTHIGATGTES